MDMKVHPTSLRKCDLDPFFSNLNRVYISATYIRKTAGNFSLTYRCVSLS